MEQNTATIIELMRVEAARHKQIAETLEAAALTLEKLGIAIPTPGFPAGGVIIGPASLQPATGLIAHQGNPYTNGNGHPAAAPAGKVGYKKPNYGVTRAIEKLIAEKYLDKKFFTFDMVSAQLSQKYPELTKNTFHSTVSYLSKTYTLEKKSAGGRDRAYLFTTPDTVQNALPAPAPDAELKQPVEVDLPMEETLYSGASL